MKGRVKKRLLAGIMAVLVVLGMVPMRTSADATQTICNVNSVRVTVAGTSNVYINEVFVDDVSVLRYLYSEDITRSENVFADLKGVFNMSETDYGDLIPDIVGVEEQKGLMTCNNPDYADEMDATWSYVGDVAERYFPNMIFEHSSVYSMLSKNGNFSRCCGELTYNFDIQQADQIVDQEGQDFDVAWPLCTLSIVNTDAVTYTVINGQLVKIIDRDIDYTCEEVQVWYCSYHLLSHWPFTDVKIKPGNWAYEGIKYTYLNGIMSGDEDNDHDGYTTFRPDGDITRGQFITTLYRMAGSPEVDGTSTFTDVKLSKSGKKPYYYDAVVWAKEKGVTTGVSDTRFAPGDNIQRQQMATMLMRYADVMGFDTAEKEAIGNYPDYSKVAKYARDALSWANAKRIITGKDKDGKKYLDPKATATRKECACILQRFCDAYPINDK